MFGSPKKNYPQELLVAQKHLVTKYWQIGDVKKKKIIKVLYVKKKRCLTLPIFTLPETNMAPKNGWLEYDRLLLGPGLFSGARHVSFREGRLISENCLLVHIPFSPIPPLGAPACWWWTRK